MPLRLVAESEQATLWQIIQRGPVGPPPAGPSPYGAPQQATGLSGERLTVTVAEVIDPGNDALTSAGYRLDDGERAVLVRTTVANAGPAAHDCMPDLYLFLLDSGGKTLLKAPVSVAGHPAHRVGVAPGAQDVGWTIFLINADTELSGVRWGPFTMVRPRVGADPRRSRVSGDGSMPFRLDGSGAARVQPARRISRAADRSSGYSLMNSTVRPSAGWANDNARACSHCRCSATFFASTGSAP